MIEDSSSGLISQNHLPNNQKGGGGGECLTDRYQSDMNSVNVAPAETLQIM
jgi:hypothetical protein